jgi:RHS repeat-associated protein
MRLQSRIVFAFIFVLCAVGPCFAQVATGTPQFGSFAGGPDVVNLGNLNDNWTIPIRNKAGRGQNFVYNLVYDSSIWYPVTSGSTKTWQPVANWGWKGLSNAGSAYILYNMTIASGTCGQTGQNTWESWTYSGLSYTDQNGVTHSFPSAGGTFLTSNGTTDCPPSQVTPPSQFWTATASDGSGMTANFTINEGSMGVTLQTKTGLTITAPIYVNSVPTSTSYTSTDGNGNEIALSGGVFTDTLGQTALTITNSTTGGVPSTTLHYANSTGTSTYTVNYTAHNIKTNFGCASPTISEYSASNVYLVSSIDLPDGSQYAFTYETTPGPSGYVTGRIASVTTPTGGTVSYAYTGGNNGIECSDGSTAGLHRTTTDTGTSAYWNYERSHGAGNLWTTTVVAPNTAQDQTAITFLTDGAAANSNFYEIERKINTGSSTPMETVLTCYEPATQTSSCSQTSGDSGTSVAAPVTRLQRTYQWPGTTALSSGYMVTYDALTNPLTQTVYDFASGTSYGSALQTTTTTYTALNTGDSVEGPQEVKVTDGGNNEISDTKYTYTTSVTTTSGTPSHQSGGPFVANLGSVQQFANGSASVSSSYTYYDTGNVKTATSASGSTTTYAYNGCTNSFLSGTSTPVGSVTLTTGAMWNCTGGVQSTSVDANGNTTTYVYGSDSYWRPTEIDYPDTGKTTLSYTPTTATANVYQSSSVFGTTEVEYDWAGRQSRTIVANGQSSNPYYQQDNCYDVEGNLYFTSYPYQGTGLGTTPVCSGSGDKNSYDALGRLTEVLHADSTSVNYTYSGRDTKYADENSVTRMTQVDGLGRPTIVCEVTSTTLLSGSNAETPGSCGTDVTPTTGFATTYAYGYSSPNVTATITQGVQTRNFQSDWLGRSVSITEPESGKTTYSYAYNSTGLQVMRTKPKANQTSASVTTTTTSQYDSIGRILTVSYSDGTGTKNFQYDLTNGWAGFTNNLKGRLAGAFVSNPGMNSYGNGYSYDAMGRVNLMGECAPSICGSGAWDMSYTYDLAGNLKTSTDGSSVETRYTVSLANELLSMTSSQSNSTNPATILSNVTNGPNGPVSYSLGNGLNTANRYDSLGRNNGDSICNGSTSFGCPGGTQIYGYGVTWSGSRVTSPCDTVIDQCDTTSYDAFNRLTSWGSSVQGLNYVYDRYGNRWQQNVTAGSAPQPQYSFNTANNQISGYSYDAAGNMINDGSHSYTYDANGNITAVDGGSTATYTYDALNHRVQTVIGSATTEFLFNANGQRVSVWNGANNTQYSGVYYWGSKPVAFYNNGQTYFQHQDWEGTERMRTSYNGSKAATFTSLPFGDAQTTASGSDFDAYHFAGTDEDIETGTDHAQFRQYNSTQGRWMRPDPYLGSYDFFNPQSFNRYAYVMNNPLSNIDPMGLDQCLWDDGSQDSPAEDGGDTEDQCNQQGGYWLTGTNTTVTVNANPPSDPPDTCIACSVNIQITSLPIQQFQPPSTPIRDPHFGPDITSCTKAPPLPSNSSACYAYGNDTYLNVNLQCFCQCAGNSAWSQQVRGCLACANQNGVNPAVSHAMCYSSAGFVNAPYGTLTQCTLTCQQ